LKDEVKIQQSNDDVSILSPIEDIINDARNGRMFILIDDEDRENEGDLVIPAQMATPDAVNFMATNGRGLICLALSRERINMLDIPLLPQSRRGGLETAFTVSIEARDGVTTGISAPDRARTISVAIDPHSRANDIVTPGHVFPLAARDGGVLVRAGHTEAGVDIARLAGLNPSSVICEIMNDDGTMARLPELIKFAQFHGIKIAAIADLIAYRRQNDRIVERLMDKDFHSEYGGDFKYYVYYNKVEYAEHVALVKGNVFPDVPTLVRMHSFSLGSDALGSVDARDSGVLQKSMEMINAEGSGIIVVIRDTSPTDESNRIKQLQSSPSSPVNELRDYGVGAQILTDLGVRDIILLSNSDRSIIGLEGFGLRVIETRSIGNKSQKKEVG
jgi:3,4-dihydroxy 2-butanone 4-phosphate synthase/GTP cyclohydrolase II|tara:strand:- start:4017 stop:5180 length:1164 start_codon:yes stop_codon:yes gene_type:complete